MQQVAAVRSVRQAVRMLKHIGLGPMSDRPDPPRRAVGALSEAVTRMPGAPPSGRDETAAGA